MLAEFARQLEPFWPVLAAGLGSLLVIVVLIGAWRRRAAWREPIKAYDREQRAIAAFRDRLARATEAPRQRPTAERPPPRSLGLGVRPRQPTRSPTPGE